MIKKLFTQLCIISLSIMLAGCGIHSKGETDYVTENIQINEETGRIDRYGTGRGKEYKVLSNKANYKKINSIVIRDLKDGYYTDELNITLEESEVEELKKCLPKLGLISKNSGWKNFYKMECYDKDGNKIFVFKVDELFNLNLPNETCLQGQNNLYEIMRALEIKYDLSEYDFNKRTPGPEYFSYCNQIAKMTFWGGTLDNIIDHQYTESELNQLYSGFANARIIGEHAEGKYYENAIFAVYAYDKWGGDLYELFVSEDEAWINGYPVDYESLKGWLSELEKESR